MKRPATAMIVVALVAAACGGGEWETAAFSVPTSVVGRVTVPDIGAGPVCRLAMGTGMGVEVVSVEPDMPVSALLQIGDVITHVDGVGVAESGDFIAIIRSNEVGDTVTVSVTRSGNGPVEADVELVELLDGTGGPMMGIGVQTAVVLQDATTVGSSGTLESALTAVVSVDGSLYAVDAIEGAWLSLQSTTPPAAWTPAAGGVYTLEEGEPDRLVNVANPEAAVDFDVEGWDGRWVLGSQAGLVLVYADRSEESGLQGAIFAVEPEEGRVAWFWSPRDAERVDFPLPIFAISSPSHVRTLVGTAQFDESGNAEVVRFSLLDLNGKPELVVPPAGGDLPSGLVAIGWHTESQIAYHQPAVGNILLWNVDTGDIDELALPVSPPDAQFVPVGDGTNFIMITGDSLDLIRGGDGPSARPLAVDCAADQIAPPGFVG